MKNLLNSVKAPVVAKSFFDNAFEHKTTFNMGELIPVSYEPVVPTDKITIGVDSLIRFEPMLAPLMHNVDVKTYTFFVPYRLLWRGSTQNNRWNDFIANIKTLGVLPAVPTISLNVGAGDETAPGTLANYLSIPYIPAADEAYNITAFNFAAYQCIWNEYFRDENLQAEVPYLLVDGSNTATKIDLCKLRKKCWEKDYFTASLPFAQKGDPVDIPLGGFNDVIVGYEQAGVSPGGGVSFTTTPAQSPPVTTIPEDSTESFIPGRLFAKTSDLEPQATTINDLRLAYTLQRWYEQLARGGTRPNEFIKVIFGIDSPDKRLQRPEYICGSSNPVMFSEVLNTTGTDDAPQGAMAGHGVGLTKGKQGSYFVQEYGVVMTLMCVQPRTAYFQGLPKQYQKNSDPTQYFITTFDHLGEQPVFNRELYAAHSAPNAEFGYLPMYHEYKVPINRITGNFQTTNSFWTMARKFASDPNLNDEFVTCTPTTDIFAVTDSDIHHILASIWVDFKASRPMSKYSTPTW